MEQVVIIFDSCVFHFKFQFSVSVCPFKKRFATHQLTSVEDSLLRQKIGLQMENEIIEENNLQTMIKEMNEDIQPGCNLILNYLPRHIDEGILLVSFFSPHLILIFF